MRYIVELTHHSLLSGAPDSSSVVHLQHLQLLSFLGSGTTSGFHGDVEISYLTVGTHLKLLQKKSQWKSIHYNLTMMITKKCYSVLASFFQLRSARKKNCNYHCEWNLPRVDAAAGIHLCAMTAMWLPGISRKHCTGSWM